VEKKNEKQKKDLEMKKKELSEIKSNQKKIKFMI
jgi:hypothetical protein